MSIKTFTVGSIAGGIVTVLAIFGVHAKAPTVAPIPVVVVSPVALDNSGAAGSEYKCPTVEWKRTDGYVAELGQGFVACEKKGVILRYFVRTHEEQALDTNIYPAVYIDPADAKKR